MRLLRTLIGSHRLDGGWAKQTQITQLAAVETGRFRDAFWRGVQIALIIFVALALYILLRGAGRRLWRLLMTHLTR